MVSKNQVVCARCHFAGLASGMDCMQWSSGESGADNESECARTAENAAPNSVRRVSPGACCDSLTAADGLGKIIIS